MPGNKKSDPYRAGFIFNTHLLHFVYPSRVGFALCLALREPVHSIKEFFAPRIFDNITDKLQSALIRALESAECADFCVGYFNLRAIGLSQDPADQVVDFIVDLLAAAAL